MGWGGLDFCGSPSMAPGPVVWDSRALPRPLQKLWGRCVAVGDRFWLAPVGWIWSTVWFESCFWLKGLCRSQRASSHAGTRSATVRGDGGSWAGPRLLQLASLAPIQATQGGCAAGAGCLPAPPSKAAVALPVEQVGRSVGLSLLPAWGCSKASQLPLQSLWRLLRQAGGEKKTSPSKIRKGEARAGAFLVGTLNGREEQGLSSLPVSLSCSTKQPPSLASEIQREVLKL